jgi:carbamoyltransferase
LIADEKVVGLFLGRMEFGPRALGARSIVGDPRSPKMQSIMNLKIKFRESFRPFAPAVLREHVGEWFELDRDSPYMLLVAGVKPDHRLPISSEARALWGIEQLNVPRSDVPAITHVDYSARIQTVRRETHPAYYDIIEAFYRRTGCPVMVNTSFNVRGEPIVCTPEDAYRCFMRTDMDVLVLGSFILEKSEQPARVESAEWREEFVLD